MQSHLVRLFDELKELRERLDLISGEAPDVSTGTVVPLFSDVKKPPSDLSSESVHEETPTTPMPEPDNPPSDSDEPIEHPSIDPEPIESETKPKQLSSAKASRLLDPIAHELHTGEAPAEVIAEYLQAAKDNLITSETPNERVARDMDVVLKFLRARGRKSIRPEERENIMKRIRRWKANL
jgi:hypothetical protein